VGFSTVLGGQTHGKEWEKSGKKAGDFLSDVFPGCIQQRNWNGL